MKHFNNINRPSGVLVKEMCLGMYQAGAGLIRVFRGMGQFKGEGEYFLSSSHTTVNCHSDMLFCSLTSWKGAGFDVHFVPFSARLLIH